MTASANRLFYAGEGLVMSVSGALLALAVLTGAAAAEASQAAGPAYAITIDPTALVSQSWWQVPGVTPSIWTSDPETSEAYRTSEVRQLSLQPGAYKFVSFTFDFPFSLTPEGTIEFSHALDQCVEGRGTRILIIKCKRTYPHGGQPDY